ncbi:MAG: glycosyltransferase family 9 protein [Thermodesulfobacteriaceae bacterium]|nr:glycosyltransferase family 9 protein [Thermodesulfobacteriaceae bacterium]
MKKNNENLGVNHEISPSNLWLFYRRGALGDTLLTFPILELLKRSGKKIWAVGNTDYFNIAKEIGWVDFLSSEIPKREFQGEILISSEGKVRPFPESRIWIVEHYMKSIGISGKFSKTLPLEPMDKSPLEGYAVIHPSSGSPKKNAPLELFFKIEKFLKEEGLKTIYLIGEADFWLKDYLKKYYESLSPLEIARALKSSLLFVGNDSGMAHLASYCGLPTFIFYGPSDPIVWKPIGEKVYQISLSLSCSPCFPEVCMERKCFNEELLYKAFLKAYRERVH